MKESILVFCRYYLPGVRAGGPIVTISNLVDLIKKQYNFKIITSDRDHGCESSYDGVDVDSWSSIAGVSAYYASPGLLRYISFIKIIRHEKPEFLYLNSLFDFGYTFIPFLIASIFSRKTKVIIAPRGELNPGALQIKSGKKAIFLPVLGWLAKLSNVVFQGTNEEEVDRISAKFSFAEVRLLENFSISNMEPAKRSKQVGELRMVLVARISPMKNVDYLMDILLTVAQRNLKDVQLTLDIYGFIEDENYWKLCEKKADALPNWIQVNYKGGLDQNQVSETISGYHLFVMPTRGENFGHSIAEALAAGTPVLISDRTPWNDLQVKGAGYALPLDSIDQFAEAIEAFALLDEDLYMASSSAVNRYYESYSKEIASVVRRQAGELFS